MFEKRVYAAYALIRHGGYMLGSAQGTTSELGARLLEAGLVTQGARGQRRPRGDRGAERAGAAAPPALAQVPSALKPHE